jgi:AbrB family looped-hinge helix DNA binding protein
MARFDGAKVKIDKFGRIVVPKPLRQRLGLTAAAELEALEQLGGLLLRPVEEAPAMARVEGLWVHRGAAQPGTDWEHLIHQGREERIGSVLKT